MAHQTKHSPALPPDTLTHTAHISFLCTCKSKSLPTHCTSFRHCTRCTASCHSTWARQAFLIWQLVWQPPKRNDNWQLQWQAAFILVPSCSFSVQPSIHSTCNDFMHISWVYFRAILKGFSQSFASVSLSLCLVGHFRLLCQLICPNFLAKLKAFWLRKIVTETLRCCAVKGVARGCLEGNFEVFPTRLS